jgi:hypothetical protein
MRIWHAATRDPQQAEAWRAAFCVACPNAVALVAPATAALATGDAATRIGVTDSMWGRVTAPSAECSWRAEGEVVALSVVSERPLDDMDLDHTEVDDDPDRSPVRLERAVSQILGATELTEVAYRRDGLAWLRRTEPSR